MIRPLVVSTECPLCGAPLDFTEGSNAVQCLHCRSNLLVTGHKQVLSYYVPPKMDAQGALHGLVEAQSRRNARCRFIKSRLYFIPYHRLTGHDFRWEEVADRSRLQQSAPALPTRIMHRDSWSSEGYSIDLPNFIEGAGRLLGKLFGATAENTQRRGAHLDPIPIGEKIPEAMVPSPIGMKRPLTTTARGSRGLKNIRFFSQYVEKNFIACNLDGFGLYSLGVRPSVLRLELFRKDRLQSLGKIVQANISSSAALLHGMRTGRSMPIHYRKVMGRILSLIYFPFWIMEFKHAGKSRVAIIDAVSQSVIKLDATPLLYKILDQEVQSDPDTIGFRPLTCPNCGWDLPVLPDNVIFFCSSCERTWQIFGNGLYEVSYRIAQWQNLGNPKRARYLPFWLLETRGAADAPSRWILPAFRYRRLKTLSDLAMRFAKEQPVFPLLKEKLPENRGCYYDQEDAVMLAQFCRAGLAAGPRKRKAALQRDELAITSATLTWFPFEIKGRVLIDPWSGCRLSEKLIL